VTILTNFSGQLSSSQCALLSRPIGERRREREERRSTGRAGDNMGRRSIGKGVIGGGKDVYGQYSCSFNAQLHPGSSRGRVYYNRGSSVSTGHESSPAATKWVGKTWGEGPGVSGHEKGYKMEEGCHRKTLIWTFSSRAQIHG
jgi:hypothetical protein